MTKQNLKKQVKSRFSLPSAKSSFERVKQSSASIRSTLTDKPRFFVQKNIQAKVEFPKIYRIITDPPLLAIRLFNSVRIRLMERFWRAGPLISEQKTASSKQKVKSGFLKWMVKAEAFWVGLAMGIVIIAIIIVSIDLNKNIAKKETIEIEKNNFSKEINYWEEISKKYKGFRDAYFKLVLLEYKIGNIEGSKKYLNEVFKIDPNFEPATKFQDLLGLPGN